MSRDLTLSEQLIATTIRIESFDSLGNQSTGSGFIYRFLEKTDRPTPRELSCLITNKHVIQGADLIRLRITIDDDSARIPTIHVPVEVSPSDFILHPSEDIDLCLLPIGPIQHSLASQGKTHYRMEVLPSHLIDEEFEKTLSAIESITMVGYPIGLWDAKNNLPICRKGITATHPAIDYNGRPEVVVDMACFPGSSGSPVFLHHEGLFLDKGGRMMGGKTMKLLGVLYAGPQYQANGEIKIVNVPTVALPIAQTSIPTNLGFVIKAREINGFLPWANSIFENEPHHD